MGLERRKKRGTKPRWGGGWHSRLGKPGAKCQSQGIKEHNLSTVKPDSSERNRTTGVKLERLFCVGH